MALIAWGAPALALAQESASSLESDAGDAEDRAPNADDREPSADSEVRLRVHSDAPGLALVRSTGSSYRSNPLAVAVVELYERICLAPCETTLPAGEYRLAIDDRGTPYPVGLRTLDEDSDLYLSIDRPRGQRAVAVLMILGGLAAAFTFLGRVVVRKDDPGPYDTLARDVGLGAAGGVLFFAGVFTLVFAETEAHVRIGPRE